jgi:hypothetical protein
MAIQENLNEHIFAIAVCSIEELKKEAALLWWSRSHNTMWLFGTDSYVQR